MLIHTIRTFTVLCAVGAGSGIIYNFLTCLTAVNFLRRRRSRSAAFPGQPAETPPVSILKPLRGTDPEMYASFRSHCLLDYPEYEILFAVHEPTDPAISLVEDLKREFPDHNIRLFVYPEALGSNIKVSNLAQVLPAARFEHVIVNDSDIRVERDYPRHIMSPFVDPEIGMVTCLYRGIAQDTLGSKLEALGISTDFASGVLMALALEGEVRFGLGSTLAMRKSDLESVGGFRALLDVLADDYELGARIAASGKRVFLSDNVVETFLPAYTWMEFIRHQLRWCRGIRDSRPWGYVGMIVTYAIPWSLLTLCFAWSATWSWILFVGALLARFSAAFLVGDRVLADLQVHKLAWLIPFRDCVGFVLWGVAWMGNTVHWRGKKYLLKNGKLTPVSKGNS